MINKFRPSRWKKSGGTLRPAGSDKVFLANDKVQFVEDYGQVELYHGGSASENFRFGLYADEGSGYFYADPELYIQSNGYVTFDADTNVRILGGNSKYCILDTSLVFTEDRTYSFPDATGVFLLDTSTQYVTNKKFGAGDNYSEFESDGTLKFNGTSTVWDDQQIDISSVRLPTSNAPSWTAYKSSQVLAFASGTDNTIYFTCQLPHGYKEGSNIEFHIHYAIPTAGSNDGAENVKWDFTHSWSSINGAIPNATPVPATIDLQAKSADTHYLGEIAGTITGTGKGISSILLCSLKRDTTVANNYAHDVYLLAADFHIEKDTVGSRQETSK